MKAELHGDRLEDKESRLEAIMVQVRDDGGFHSGHGLGTEEVGMDLKTLRGSTGRLW